MHIRTSILIFSLALITTSCQDKLPKIKDHEPYQVPLSFEKVPTENSGFKFKNVLDEMTMKNPFNYINAYNGGGVAIGDLNNDGLQDIYVTGNMVSSKLYINKGDMEFEDVTLKAGVKTKGWCTGVTLADVNSDGWLDIYVCRSYEDDPNLRGNLLFINNKNGSFIEKSKNYGLFDSNYSIAASFFDYDRDGDMDLIVANHPRYRLIALKKHYDLWKDPVLHFSSRLFRNDGQNKFTDVTATSGVLSYGFSLGVTTSDLDNDGWPDIFITVDHDEPDIVLHNNGDGTFTNIIDSALKSNTRSSMGVDVGDLNGDPFPEIVVAEMLSEDHYREKASMGMQTVSRFELIIDSLKYKYYQMRNYLHLNNGNNTFSDIGQYAGIQKTDWSWSTIFMDVNNDERQDLFFANGYYRDIYDQDRKRKFDKEMMSISPDRMEDRNELAAEYARNCPQTKLKNYLFKNSGELQFEKATEGSGLNDLTISTGAAYGDLDNDGDLDLIVNNLGDYSMIYENKVDDQNNYLRIKLKHNIASQPYGAKAIIEYDGKKQYRELLSSRGYQSFSEPFFHFGLGTVSQVDKVTIVWPVGYQEVLTDVKANQVLEMSYENAKENFRPIQDTQFIAHLSANESGIDYDKKEQVYNDLKDQVLIPHKLSELGPHVSKGDVNGDGMEDVFIGASKDRTAALFIQNSEGKFQEKKVVDLEKDKGCEDMQSAFFDVDGDNDQDLLVVSGSYEFDQLSTTFKPRLYLNDGSGDLKRSESAFPDWYYASSCVEVTDLDKDGDMDIFVGGRLTPKRYPEPGTSAIFINDGKGVFKNEISKIAPGLKNIGMVTDALWTDVNNDGDQDLIVVGEWMPISIWVQENGKFVDRSATYGTADLTGWWNCIHKADLDGDGNEDFVVGNLGLNYKYKASAEKPFVIYGKDFDKSGTCDIALGAYYGDKLYPVRGRSCSSEQMPMISQKFKTFDAYANADFEQVYGNMLNDAYHYKATEFASVILYGTSSGSFEVQKLPTKCQLAPVNDMVITDLNEDGKKDLIVAGNMHQSEIETGKADAGTGVVLLNLGGREWETLEVHESGLYISNDVKSLELVKLADGSEIMVVGNNQERAQVIKLK